jgi:tRNA U34 5-methylaminomethyl-2-thiouridine-forming methyltransferase MnmC
MHHPEEPAADFDLVPVRAGVRSLRSRAHGETFHPVLGPLGEAEALHVRQQRLVERAAAMPDGTFVVWDVGLGAAANAIATLEAFRGFGGHARIELHSFEISTAALEFALQHAEELGYPAGHEATLRAILTEGSAQAGPIAWRLHRGDYRKCLREAPAPHAIFHDPYSPRANPAMWSLECFGRVHAALSPDAPCLMTSYTRSTAVRVTLLLAGFFAGHGVAIADKTETTVAANRLDLLEAPLEAAWLRRVRASTRSAPLRDNGPGGAISDADLERLREHPQFR